jgi:hypothetical protein
MTSLAGMWEPLVGAEAETTRKLQVAGEAERRLAEFRAKVHAASERWAEARPTGLVELLYAAADGDPELMRLVQVSGQLLEDFVAHSPAVFARRYPQWPPSPPGTLHLGPSPTGAGRPSSTPCSASGTQSGHPPLRPDPRPSARRWSRLPSATGKRRDHSPTTDGQAHGIATGGRPTRCAPSRATGRATAENPRAGVLGFGA